MYQATLSTDRPSYPLLSARQVTQCVVSACQSDRRWSRQDSYLNGLGLRIYRCRIYAPNSRTQGVRQDPNANPFEGLELIKKRQLGKIRSTCLEFTLEPNALYLATVDSQYRCPFFLLRFACSADVQFRELSAKEADHFIAAQADAAPAAAGGGSGFPRSLSEATSVSDWGGDEACAGHDQCLGNDALGFGN